MPRSEIWLGLAVRALITALRWAGAVVGASLVVLGLLADLTVLRVAGISLGILLFVLGILVNYWYLRPNQAVVAPSLAMETWDMVKDGRHNSNTDMIHWQGAFFLVHAASPFHFGTDECRLVLWRSEDGKLWNRVAELAAPGEDIRDPKFAPIEGRLFLYALKNTSFDPEPYTTVFSTSDDGLTWSSFENVEPKGWLFWRPRTADGRTWYVPAYWHEHGEAILLRSYDGVNWITHSTIHTGTRGDETDIEFQNDGQMIATARLEIRGSWFGHPQACTLITVARPPYRTWSPPSRSTVTRLDGPCLFHYGGQVYAVGRYQPRVRGPFTWQGSIFSCKRTALFLIREDGLIRLSDLPSAGDTSYAGVAVRGSELWICYYTSDTQRDYSWILGMVSPSDIRLAKIDLETLEALATRRATAGL